MKKKKFRRTLEKYYLWYAGLIWIITVVTGYGFEWALLYYFLAIIFFKLDMISQKLKETNKK